MAAPKVFVSHSHQDNAYCREFVAALRKGLGSDEAVWYDEHNLGWGALRQVIETEIAQRQHFIAILSPAAVASTWVNAEIDAALGLVNDGSMQTIQFVMAAPCTVPLLLRRYKRIEQPTGAGYSPAGAAAKAVQVIAPIASEPAPSQSQRPASPPDRFPKRLANLGFTARASNGVEYILPPTRIVSAGAFLMGSDRIRDTVVANANWAKQEEPQHGVTLPTYEIACYPVTVAEYACFVRSGQPEPKRYEYHGRVLDWQVQLQRLDHPVVCVTWNDALVYAGWLSECSGEWWRLPTEAEWEKAARGTDGRIYPWGDDFFDGRCNSREGSKNASTPVGTYPTGVSPYGIQDMAGNVWEWTGSRHLAYPYTTSDERKEVGSLDKLVMRGGGWDDPAFNARAAGRHYAEPDFYIVTLGFRLVRATPT